jgi:polyadenylate-binding protein
VLVRNIDLEVDQQSLFDAFSKFGAIKSCKLESYPDGKSRGFGYIQFENADTAEKAITASAGLEFNGKKVEALPHQKREERKTGDNNAFYNIFVQKLPAGTDDKKLEKMFSEFGEITSAHVQRGDDNSQYKDFGYVSFKETESAAQAVEKKNKTQQDDGSYLLVNQHISKRENEVSKSSTSGPIQNSMKKTYESNLFVKNIPTEINEEEVIKLFAECGPVMSVKLRQGKYFNPSAAYRQYFVLYQDIESAKSAIQKFDQSTPFGARALSV